MEGGKRARTSPLLAALATSDAAHTPTPFSALGAAVALVCDHLRPREFLALRGASRDTFHLLSTSVEHHPVHLLDGRAADRMLTMPGRRTVTYNFSPGVSPRLEAGLHHMIGGAGGDGAAGGRAREATEREGEERGAWPLSESAEAVHLGPRSSRVAGEPQDLPACTRLEVCRGETRLGALHHVRRAPLLRSLHIDFGGAGDDEDHRELAVRLPGFPLLESLCLTGLNAYPTPELRAAILGHPALRTLTVTYARDTKVPVSVSPPNIAHRSGSEPAVELQEVLGAAGTHYESWARFVRATGDVARRIASILEERASWFDAACCEELGVAVAGGAVLAALLFVTTGDDAALQLCSDIDMFETAEGAEWPEHIELGDVPDAVGIPAGVVRDGKLPVQFIGVHGAYPKPLPRRQVLRPPSTYDLLRRFDLSCVRAALHFERGEPVLIVANECVQLLRQQRAFPFWEARSESARPSRVWKALAKVRARTVGAEVALPEEVPLPQQRHLVERGGPHATPGDVRSAMLHTAMRCGGSEPWNGRVTPLRLDGYNL